MTDEKLNSIRKHEDAEIIKHLEAISQIVEKNAKDVILSLVAWGAYSAKEK